MMNRMSRERFGQALLEVQLQELEQICKQYPEDIPVSKRHQRAMRRILRGGHPMRTKVIAILVAAALLLLVGCSIYIARRRIANFFEEVFDTHAKVTTEETAAEVAGLNEVYTLTYVPEGYKLKYSESNFLLNLESWSDGRYLINFEQQLLTSHQFYDVEHSDDIQSISIDSINLYYRVADNFYQYLWMDDTYIYKLSCEEDFPNNIIFEIINSIQIKIEEISIYT